MPLQFARMCAGLALFLFALALPVYFSAVDRSILDTFAKTSLTAEKSKQIYLDSAKPSIALRISSCIPDSEDTKKLVEAIYQEKPSWRLAGGNEPFFDAFSSSLGISKSENAHTSFYELLVLKEYRSKLLQFLNQSDFALVKKTLSLRDVNTSTLPAAYTAAGAPFEVAILTIAFLIQSGDISSAMLPQVVSAIDSAREGDTANFETLSITILSFSKALDWTELRVLFSNFISINQAYNFAKLYRNQKNETYANALLASVYMSSGIDGAYDYLNTRNEKYWESFVETLKISEGSLRFLYSQDKPLYIESELLKFFSEPISLMRSALSLPSLCADMPKLFLVIKVVLLLLSGYLILRGFFNIIYPRKDTPSWHSTLSLIRGFFEACIFTILALAFIEPQILDWSISQGEPPEINLTIQQLINTVKEDGMNFKLDTTTIMAMSIFLIVQFTIYVIGLIRISSIKRSSLSSAVKLELLNNETDLFDLGLYVGLWGTVLSLVLLSLGIVQASLMTAYTSTLFGILFSAMLKIINLRTYRRKLIIETRRQQEGD